MMKNVSMLSDKVTDALYRTVTFKLSKPLKQRINQFSSSVPNYSNEDIFDLICNILNSCFVHFVPNKNECTQALHCIAISKSLRCVGVSFMHAVMLVYSLVTAQLAGHVLHTERTNGWVRD